MPTNDFLPFAASGTAYVDTQATYAGSGYQLNGHQPGVVLGKRLNKSLRQGSVMANVLGGMIMNALAQNVQDNGDLATLQAQLVAAIQAVAAASAVPKCIVVPMSATPVFDCAIANPVFAVFEMTLTGNVSSSTIINAREGQSIVIAIVQDATGGRTFVAPPLMHMAPIDTTPGQLNTQAFIVLNGGFIFPTTALQLSL